MRINMKLVLDGYTTRKRDVYISRSTIAKHGVLHILSIAGMQRACAYCWHATHMRGIYLTICERLLSRRFPSPNPIGRGTSPARLRPIRRREVRGRSCPLEEPIDPAVPGEDRSPCLVQKFLHTSTAQTTRRRKRLSPGSTPPRTVWKHQPDRPITD